MIDVANYAQRIGLDPATVTSADYETLSRLVAAHVKTVPFETLAVAGDPYGVWPADGVSLDPAVCYRKVVERRRGGFCYELNGLFGQLLDALGYDATRVASMMLGDDGDPSPPANHLAHVVELDRRYVIDVGMGTPRPRRPLPLDGESHVDAAGVGWRVVDSDRPDADFLVQRRPPDGAWTGRYVFQDRHRPRSFFAATCEYLATAPESPFTGDPVVAVSSERGYRKLRPDSFVRVTDGERTERDVDAATWYEFLEREFDLALAQP